MLCCDSPELETTIEEICDRCTTGGAGDVIFLWEVLIACRFKPVFEHVKNFLHVLQNGCGFLSVPTAAFLVSQSLNCLSVSQLSTKLWTCFGRFRFLEQDEPLLVVAIWVEHSCSSSDEVDHSSSVKPELKNSSITISLSLLVLNILIFMQNNENN